MTSSFDVLTDRQREVAILIAAGMPLTAIAVRLSIGYPTVRAYRANLRTRLGLRSDAGLTLLAIREGVISMHDDPMHDEAP